MYCRDMLLLDGFEKYIEKRNTMLRKKNEEACFKNVENYKKIVQIGDVE